MKSLSVFVATFTVGLVLGGCSAPAEEEAGADESNVVAGDATSDRKTDAKGDARTTPITLENWKTHPAIVATDAEVAKIEALGIESDMNMACTMTVKWATSGGPIRKHQELASGVGFSGDVTLWYTENGRPLLAVSKTSADTAIETKAYFDDAGKVMWQVTREGAPEKSDLSDEPFRAPRGADEELVIAPEYLKPAEWFEQRDCE